MKRIFVLMSILLVGAVTSGCASITHDSHQLVKIETYDSAGVEVKGADCKIQNDTGAQNVTTPAAATIRRSNKDLLIECKKASTADANGRAISRTNAGIWGNIILGGGIGAIVDHSTGKGYNYPTWLKLVMGKTLVFDRSDDKEGQPSVAKDPAPEKTAKTEAAAAK